MKMVSRRLLLLGLKPRRSLGQNYVNYSSTLTINDSSSSRRRRNISNFTTAQHVVAGWNQTTTSTNNAGILPNIKLDFRFRKLSDEQRTLTTNSYGGPTVLQELDALRDQTSMLCNKKMSPLGSYTVERWRVAIDTIYSWISIGDVESVDKSFFIFERLLSELEHSKIRTELEESFNNTSLINDLIRNWEQHWRYSQSRFIISASPGPFEIYEKLMSYSLLSKNLKPNLETYSIIIRACDIVNWSKDKDGFSLSKLENVTNETIKAVAAATARADTNSDIIVDQCYNSLVKIFVKSSTATLKAADAMLKTMRDKKIPLFEDTFFSILAIISNEMGYRYEIKHVHALLESLRMMHEAELLHVNAELASLHILAFTPELRGAFVNEILGLLKATVPEEITTSTVDATMYEKVIKLWAMEDANTAHEILNKMCDNFLADNTKARPNLKCFNFVLKAYARSVNSGKIVDELFDRMEEINLEPDIESIDHSLGVCAISSDLFEKKSEKRVISLLSKMETLSNWSDGNERNFHHVLGAYQNALLLLTRSGDADQIGIVLKQMEKAGVSPDIRFYREFVNVLPIHPIQKGLRITAASVNLLVEHVDKFSLTDNIDLIPMCEFWQSIIKCLTRCANSASIKAETILSKIEELSDEMGDSKILSPNLYQEIIRVHIRNKDEKSAIQMFKRACSRLPQGPTCACLSMILSAKSRSGGRDAGKKAEELLQLMKDSPAGLAPENCHLAIKCWLNSGHLEAFDRANKLLMEWEQFDKETNFTKSYPLHKAYHDIMKALATAGQAEMAEALIRRMWDQYRAGNVKAKPSVAIFNYLLRAYTNSGLVDGSFRIEAVLKHMEMLDNLDSFPFSVRPSIESFCIALDYWKEREEKEKAAWARDKLRGLNHKEAS